MGMAKIVDYAKEKTEKAIDLSIKATIATIGAASGGAVLGATGAGLGAGIGFIVLGPAGAAVGYGIGSIFGTGTGVVGGVIGGNKIGKILANSLKED